MNLKNNRGFSLMELIIVGAGISGMFLAVIEMRRSTLNSQNETVILSEYVELKKEVNSIVERSAACKASLSGKSFFGTSIKDTPVTGFELWTVDQSGNRTRKRVYTNQKYGKLLINSVELTMPDYTAAANFPVGTDQSFDAELKVELTKVNFGKSKANKPIVVPLTVGFSTDSSGESKISSCMAVADTTVKSYLDIKRVAFSAPGSGTWTVPAGIKEVLVTLTGAGGGGSGRGSVLSCSGSGAGATAGGATTFGSVTALGGGASTDGANGANATPTDYSPYINSGKGGVGLSCEVNNDPYPPTVYPGRTGGDGAVIVKKIAVSPGDAISYSVGAGGQASVSMRPKSNGAHGMILLEY